MSVPRKAKGSSPTKRRRSRAEMDRIRDRLLSIARENAPCTVRQVFYLATTEQLLPKTQASYKTVGRLLTELRLRGRLPFECIADNTRWMRRPSQHDRLHDLLEDAQETYRRNLWQDVDCYIEVWCEKEALAGVFYEETARWGVPLMVTRGYSSISYVHSAAETIRAVGRNALLYYFGDWDPSGTDISRNVEARLREFAPEAAIEFRRVAILPWQIEAWSLPTRPTKKTDSRAKDFRGESVELDAIPPRRLRSMVRELIEARVPAETLRRHQEIEQAERSTLREFIERMRGEQ